ncbi:NYN domain-containing protein [Sphingomonas oligophenolica]|uniref:NYN domain-containing protein n=1 Tax=Sphingomonas oligophenolica TaxID=301154 RepID=A0A502CML3_9SPHN|nr:NYN domain-containing protein [Sphingomonas oligophenolica]TPG14437.1 NYN domain-containing protein [Sphingomonas oligophenolica]
MTSEHQRPQRLAILIDAENASPRVAQGLFEEVAAIGEASVRRIYGDFSGSRLKGWSEVLAIYAINPRQNFASTIGKNASDIALVIDAMDLLYTGRFDGFCLVSSDSDFAGLAARIREQGVDVYGFGERKTPDGFRKACKRFIFTENLTCLAGTCSLPITGTTDAAMNHSASLKQPPDAAEPHIRTAMAQLDDTNGWHFLGAVGSRLAVLMPDFDARTYGCSKLVTLIEKLEAFEIRRDNLKVYVRPKEVVGT